MTVLMVLRCKVCNCNDEVRHSINESIMKGMPFKKIQSECNDLGLNISTTSLKRHADSHIPGYTPRNQKDQNIDNSVDIEQRLTESTILEPVMVNSVNIASCTDLAEFSKATIPQLIANQITITLTKQELHMNGKGRHPTEEIKSLLLLVNLSDRMTGTRPNRKHIFDMDRAIDTEPDPFEDLLKLTIRG